MDWWAGKVFECTLCGEKMLLRRSDFTRRDPLPWVQNAANDAIHGPCPQCGYMVAAHEKPERADTLRAHEAPQAKVGSPTMIRAAVEAWAGVMDMRVDAFLAASQDDAFFTVEGSNALWHAHMNTTFDSDDFGSLAIEHGDKAVITANHFAALIRMAGAR